MRGLQVMVVLAGLALFIKVTGEHYPIKQWLFWRYAGYWLAATFWATACTSAGARSLELLRTPRLPLIETLVYAFAVGVLVFFFAMFGAGFVGQLKPWLFVALPGSMLLFGAPASLRLWQRARAIRRQLALRPRAPRSVLHVVAVAYGVAALGYLYISIMHPENTSYDARWYHLGIAEHYVAEGAIRRFPEGWHLGAFPFLPSIIFTWAFLAPRTLLFDKVEICAHMEFTFLLATLLGIVALHRRLVPRASGSIAWVSLFLFPGILLYDSALHLGSDHLAACFAPPMFLLLLRTARDKGVTFWLLFSIVCSAALLTKYSVTCLLAFPALMVIGRALLRTVAAVRGRGTWKSAWLGPLVLLGSGLVLTAPHWLKNWVWYGNPVFPYAYEIFGIRPWDLYNTEAFIRFWTQHPWQPKGTTAERLKEAMKVLFTFSFYPHEWPIFHGAVPVFGSLFTLTTAVLPLMRASLRIWALTASCYLGVYIWFSGMQFDRYLQVILPWMAVATSVILLLLWRTGVIWMRLAVGALVLVQVAWGLDIVAIPAHAMTGQPPVQKTLSLIGAGYRKDYDKRLHVFEPYSSIGDTMVPGDKILLHEHHLRLGLKVPVVSDALPIQAGIDYATMGGATGVYKRMRKLGVTHVIWIDNFNLGAVSYASELVFYHFVRRHAPSPRRFGNFQVARLVERPPLADKPLRVAYFGCQGGFRWGLYSLEAVHFEHRVIFDPSAYPRPLRTEGADYPAANVLAEADYVIHNPGCRPEMPADWQQKFTQLQTHLTDKLYVRKDLLP